MTDETITIQIPVPAYQQLQRVARQQRRDVPDVVRDMVLHDLPALPSLPPDVEEELAAFTNLSDDVLWLVARSTMAEAQREELAELNDATRRQPLTGDENKRHLELVDLYHRTIVRRAQAAALLKRRGYDLSNPAVLQTP